MKNKRLIQPYSVPGCTATAAVSWEMQALNSALFYTALLTSTTELPPGWSGKGFPLTEKGTKMKHDMCLFTSSGQLFLCKSPLGFNTTPTEVTEEFCHWHSRGKKQALHLHGFVTTATAVGAHCCLGQEDFITFNSLANFNIK